METEHIAVLEKNKVLTGLNKDAAGCCGGAPARNEDACCKLDEEKKAEGESGCGCQSAAETKSKGGCC